MLTLTRRAVVAIVPAIVLMLVGWGTAQAQPAVDLDSVVTGLQENGYYVDPKSEYLAADGDLDNLRSALSSGPSPVFAVVLPDSVQPEPVLEELPKLVGRPGTYVVLAGDDFAAVSKVVPADQVTAAMDDAAAKNPGRPDLATLALIQHFAKGGPPAVVLPPEGANLPPLVDVQDPAAQREAEDGGGWGVVGLAAGGIALLLAVGWFAYRGRNRSSSAGVGANGDRRAQYDAVPSAPPDHVHNTGSPSRSGAVASPSAAQDEQDTQGPARPRGKAARRHPDA